MRKLIFGILVLTMLSLSGCRSHDDVREPADIMGVWSPDASNYYDFTTENEVHHLTISYQDGLSIGRWNQEVYYYEPGYQLVIYLSGSYEAIVYEIVTLNSRTLTWCPVDVINGADAHNIGQIIGDIIKQAQEGYKLDPSLYQTFRKVSEDEYLEVVESLDVSFEV